MTGDETPRPTPMVEENGHGHSHGTGRDDPTPPYALVQNDDETERTVSISVGHSDGRATGGQYQLSEDHERAVGLGASLGGVCRIDVNAESGASARIALDPARVGPAPVPRFFVRGDRIAVSGLSFPSEASTDPGRKGEDTERPDPGPQ
jgi:hypothetical protein